MSRAFAAPAAILAAVAAAVSLSGCAGTGPAEPATATSSAPLTVTGHVIAYSNPYSRPRPAAGAPCETSGDDPIYVGGEVMLTDAAGQIAGLGVLGGGTTRADGRCLLPFTIAGVTPSRFYTFTITAADTSRRLTAEQLARPVEINPYPLADAPAPLPG